MSTERIKKVAKIIVSYVNKKYRVIVVSSAMSGVTNDLVKKSEEISNNFANTEYDVLLSAGEQISCSLIAGRLTHLGHISRSMLAWQIPIITDNNYSLAKIKTVDVKQILKHLKTRWI